MNASKFLFLVIFLVGAFSFKEKSPTITVDSFFFFFFVRPQSSSRMYHFLQKLISSLRPSSTNANLLQRVPPFVFYLFYVTYKTGRLQRVPPFNFFWTVRIFFRNFLISQKSPPFGFFEIFCNRKYVNESQRVPPFHCSALCDVFEVFSEKKTFQKNFFSKKIFQIFLFPVGKNDFPVISSMKGTLWVSRKCFQSFS